MQRVFELAMNPENLESVELENQTKTRNQNFN